MNWLRSIVLLVSTCKIDCVKFGQVQKGALENAVFVFFYVGVGQK